METTTIGVFNNHEEAENAINELKEFGVKDADLSYIYKNEDGDVKDDQSGDKMGSGAAKGAGTGALIGGIAGLIVANGILPGLGTLFVAGPLATALGVTGATAAGAVTGAAAGGLIGALTNLGVKKEDAELYENHVQSGDIVVIARGTPESTADIFDRHGAMDVRYYEVEE
jgi:uncharacterized membrane protein